jgi:hypothetical protein
MRPLISDNRPAKLHGDGVDVAPVATSMPEASAAGVSDASNISTAARAAAIFCLREAMGTTPLIAGFQPNRRDTRGQDAAGRSENASTERFVPDSPPVEKRG